MVLATLAEWCIGTSSQSIVGVGISATELACNDQLSRYVAQDLNSSPKLPFADRSFDVVTCVVSFDYLTRPLDVMKEVRSRSRAA